MTILAGKTKFETNSVSTLTVQIEYRQLTTGSGCDSSGLLFQAWESVLLCEVSYTTAIYDRINIRPIFSVLYSCVWPFLAVTEP